MFLENFGSISLFTKFILWLFLCLLLVLTFVGIVLIRITVPRFKLETLSKLGWKVSLVVIFVFFSCWLSGWLLF